MHSAGQDAPDSLDLAHAREVFEASTDFTIGLEEEFALVDPDSLELVHRFEELRDASAADPLLAESVAGELIDTEIEIRSGRAEGFAEATELQIERRRRLFDRARALGIGLAATGTHPWANYLDQQIIDTEHYNRLREELRWVAQRNNTWSLHVHVGVRGADRAIAVCDHLRSVLPPLLALSANSPFLDGQDTGLALGADRDLHPHLPSLRRSRAVRQLGHLRRLRRPARGDRARGRGDRSCGGACGPITRSAPSSCASATRRRGATRRSRSRR